jgi:glycine/D-amino acid oxidase-like deaminating enzyme
VKTRDGTLYEADVVVNCAGRWANDPVSEAGLHLPLAPTVGLLGFTPPVPARLRRVVRAPDIHTRPDGAGRLVCIAPTEQVPPFDPRPSVATLEVRELAHRLRRLLPVIGDVEAEAARMAIRPIPGDSYSAIGPVPRVEGYYLAITHSGVTMSPFLGKAAADEIVHGRQYEALADFRPARFFN